MFGTELENHNNLKRQRLEALSKGLGQDIDIQGAQAEISLPTVTSDVLKKAVDEGRVMVFDETGLAKLKRDCIEKGGLEDFLSFQNTLTQIEVITPLEKAERNLSQLTKKTITDKNGRKQTVWVKGNEDPKAQRSAAKPEEGGDPKQPKQEDSASKVGSHEIAQLYRVKQKLEAGDHSAAAKIANTLSDEAKNMIPHEKWKGMHEASDKDTAKEEAEAKKEKSAKETSKEKPTTSGKETGITKKRTSKIKDHHEAIKDYTKEKLSSFVSKNKAMFDTGEHAHPERSKAAKFLRGKVKGIVKGLKHEVEHMKEVGSAFKKMATGKKPNEHEKKALKKVGISLGLTIGTMLATGGASVFAHGAHAFFQHLGAHFVEHALLETTILATMFAKAVEEELSKSGKDSLDDEQMEKLVNGFIDYVENGDWSDFKDDTEEE